MPREATVDEIELFRSDGQAAKLYASFFVPHVVYTAVLSSVPSTTDMVAQISFTSGSGTLANVKQDMLLKVGSTAGGQELGIARIRKAPIAGTFYIGEQSIIDWSAATPVYLTVVDDFDLWGRHVRIDGTTIYMDYEIVFSDQHTTFNPVPVLGPVVRVAKLEDASVVVQLGPETGYASWVHGSTISTYLWSCATAVSFSSTSAVRPTATFNTTGWHVVYCLVTAANGKTRTGVRYVYIWSDDAPPLTVFQMSDCVEDNKTGGSGTTLSFSDQASLTEIPDRSLCVVFAEDYYGVGDEQERISIGAVAGAENVVFIGRLVEESLSYDEESHRAQLDIQGYQELMKRVQGFPAGLRFKISPAVWTDMPAMTVDRALWHLLEWHTTALTIMDFNRTGDTRYTAQAFSPFASIWEQLQEFAYKQIVANTHIDHLGRLWVEIDPLITPVADRNYPVVMELTDNDLTGRVDLPRSALSEVGQINSSGVVVDGGGNATAFFSLSPGHVHDRTGRIDIVDRLLLEDQTQANELAGLLFAAKNNPYKPMRIKLRGNNRLITCFPNQAITYTISAANNPRGFAVTKNWIPRQRKISYDGETGTFEIELVIEAETTPALAVTGDVPGSDDFSFPPLPGLPSLPSIPVILPGGVPSGSDGGPPSILVHDTTAGLLLCNNFDAGENEQEWYAWNAGLTVGQSQNIVQMKVAPNGAIWVSGGSSAGAGFDHFIARAPYAGGTFEIIETQASINTALSTTGHSGEIGSLVFNPLLSEYVVYILCTQTACKIYRGNYGGITALAGFTTDNAKNGDISYGNNKWRLTSGFSPNPRLRIFDGALTALETLVTPTDFLQFGQTRHRPVSTTDKMIHYQGTANTIAISEGNGASIVSDIGSNYNLDTTDQESECLFALDPTGQTICTTRSSTGKGKSSDYGSTLSDIANLPVGGWRFAWAGDVGAASKWVAVGAYVYYTDDFWVSSPVDKRGNILDLAPILALDNVKILSF